MSLQDFEDDCDGNFDPIYSMAVARHEFGEHGGVNMSTENSTTFTVMEPEEMANIFDGKLGHDGGYYLYSRHFNPTVAALSRKLAAMEGTEAAYCTGRDAFQRIYQERKFLYLIVC